MSPFRPSLLPFPGFLLVLWLGTATAADQFVSNVEDLPLMPGLTEAIQDGLVFDTPSGRIVQAVASGGVSRRAVVSFYTETLPQLGWSPAEPTRYHRENEVLTIEIDDAVASGVTVRFEVAPSKTGNLQQ